MEINFERLYNKQELKLFLGYEHWVNQDTQIKPMIIYAIHSKGVKVKGLMLLLWSILRARILYKSYR